MSVQFPYYGFPKFFQLYCMFTTPCKYIIVELKSASAWIFIGAIIYDIDHTIKLLGNSYLRTQEHEIHYWTKQQLRRNVCTEMDIAGETESLLPDLLQQWFWHLDAHRQQGSSYVQLHK